MPYTKLDAAIIFSTIWREPHTTLRVWIALLATKDARGEVAASVPGLADAARVTVPECEVALATFRAPDKYSRTQEYEGRRIEDIPGGWFVINHAKFRELDSGEDRKRKDAQRAKRYRDRHVTSRDVTLRNVTVTQPSPPLSHTDTDTDTNNNKDLTTTRATHVVADFDLTWSLYPNRKGGNNKADARRAWNARMRKGVNPNVILEGVQRYALFCEATARVGTEYVKMAATFFGPSEHWLEPWDIPAKPKGKHDIDWTQHITEK